MTAGPPTTSSPPVGSPILALARHATELKAGGYDIVDLTLGEPDFAPPSHVADAAIEAARQPLSHTPSNGMPTLREVIRHAATRDRGLTCLFCATDTVVLEEGCRRIVAALERWR